MCTDDATNDATNDATSSEEAQATESVSEATPRTSWNRRTFLKAAALGTAAAALLNRDSTGMHFGPLSALAQSGDLSALQCTANDMRVIGRGRILNEPCNCASGSFFDARVEFTVENNAAADRYCATLHLCPVMVNGKLFAPDDILLNGIAAIPGKTRLPYVVTIPNYPCNAGNICFGVAGPEEFGVFPKGAPCPTGECCSTITYNVKASDPCPDTTRQIASKCRHQQICIQGRSVSLKCIAGCPVTCGGTATLQLCGTGMGALTFSLKDGSGKVYTAKSMTTECATYDVTVAATTTFTGTVTDSGTPPCANTATLKLEVAPIVVTSASGTPPACAGGNSTLNACASGGGEITYAFSEGGKALCSNKSSTGCGSCSALLTSGPHTITVVATNASGCTDDETFTVTVPTAVAITAASGTPPACVGGNSILTASASGGTGTITYEFFEGATSLGKGSPLSIVLGSGSHSLTVIATDGNGCTANMDFTVTVPTPVKADLALAAERPCAGGLTFNAAVSGGTAPYTITFSVDGVAKQTGTGTSFVYGPVLDGTCHVVSVSATDSNRCPSTPITSGGDKISVSQCVTTTVCPAA